MDEKKLEKITIEFGNRVKEVRMSKNLTQLDLAAKIGVDIRQIQRIENAETTTNITSAYLIAKALNISVQELFDFKI